MEPELGQVPVWTVGEGAAIPTVRDCYGKLRHAQIGEARFWGARRVENKVRYSSDLTFSPNWFSVGSASVEVLSEDSLDPDSKGTFRAHRLAKLGGNSARVQIIGVLPASLHTLSVYVKAGSLSQVFLQLYVSGGPILASKTFDVVTDKWTRVQISGIPDGSSSYRFLISPGPYTAITPGDVLVCDVQLEDVSGQENEAASEFVRTDAPRQALWANGAMVDRVQYFDTYKGNTVSTLGIIREANGGLIPTNLLKGLRLDPRAVNLCTFTESFTSWQIAAADAVLLPKVAISPRCDSSASRLSETTSNGSKTISQDIGLVSLRSGISLSCFAKAESAEWLVLAIQLSDGASVSAFFNLGAGEIGSIKQESARPAWAHIESWADGWYRCVLTAENSYAGSGNSTVRVGISNGDAIKFYAGSNRALLIWGAQAEATEYASSYIPNDDGSGPANRQSQSIEIPNPDAQIIGLQNFSVELDAHLAYYSGVTVKGGAVPAWRAIWYGLASGFDGPQNRLGVAFRPRSAVAIGDRYLGDPNPLYYWKSGRTYSVGDVVIPTRTELDNPTGEKMFICVAGGISGATEPAWDETFVSLPDATTHVTRDGGVTWQNNHPDLEGKWQPFDTSTIDQGYSVFAAAATDASGARSDVSAAPVVRSSYYSAPGEYGFAINGTVGHLVTRPFPIDGSLGGDLHKPLASIRFGRLEESATMHPLSICNITIRRASITAEENRIQSTI